MNGCSFQQVLGTQTSLRLLQDVLKRSRLLQPNQTSSRRLEKDVWFRASWRHLIYVVLKMFNSRRLEDVWIQISWGHLIYDVLKTSNLCNLEDVQFTTSWRRLVYDILRTSDLQRLEDVQFTSSWRRPIYDVLKTSVKQHLCSNVVVKCIQRQKKWLFLILYSLKFQKI